MSDRKLIIVTGAARSGTSAMAGTLHQLGLHVPGPFLRANESNPRGFFESSWSVRFHNSLLKQAQVSLTDGRPDAVERVRAAVGPRTRERLRSWLSEVSDGVDQTVVKDPRTMWTLDLWSEVAAELGLATGVVVMLRHPAGVLGSRATYYAAARDRLGARAYATKNLGTWINATLNLEAQTRGQRRVFVRYVDLLENWPAELARVADELEITLEKPLDATQPDSFVDKRLHRIRTGWDDVSVPTDLRDIADEVWSACCELADRSADDGLHRRLDAAKDRYAQIFADAASVSSDVCRAAALGVRAEAAREARVDTERRQPARPPSVRSRLVRGLARRGRAVGHAARATWPRLR